MLQGYEYNMTIKKKIHYYLEFTAYSGGQIILS